MKTQKKTVKSEDKERQEIIKNKNIEGKNHRYRKNF